jgi:serine/threonine protein kinase
MGEVYRARDTRLKREVAVKILPASCATDPERLARFQREAEVLASLNRAGSPIRQKKRDGPRSISPGIRVPAGRSRFPPPVDVRHGGRPTAGNSSTATAGR